jgi:hypothetical protein
MNNVKRPDGYEKIGLRKDGIVKYFLIHRLLAINFIPNPNNYNEIDHIDRNKSNNSLENLRWVSHQTNMRNRKFVACRNGSIRVKKITKLGEYFRADFYIDYNKSINKCSYDKKLLEDWLEELKIKYKRDYVYHPPTLNNSVE